MSLADHVKLRADPELELAIELKYGKPNSSAEYVYSLPLTVVKRMNSAVEGITEEDEDILRLNLQYAIGYSQWVSKKLQEELFLYHSLLGRV